VNRKASRPVVLPSIVIALVFAAAGCSQAAPLRPAAPPHAAALGAEAYHQWMMTCIDAIENDVPQIIRSAEAAAKLHVQEGYPILAMGDSGFISEASGRAGGMITLIGMYDSRRRRRRKMPPNAVVLYCLRDGSGQKDFDRINALAQPGKMVIVFGRGALLAKARKAGLPAAAMVDTHAAAHGGLFKNSEGRWVVPTGPVADLVALWTWTGEFVAACTRLGKMPVMYQAYGTPGGRQWARDLKGKTFHDQAPAKVPSGKLAREFLQKTRKCLTALREKEAANIRKAARWAMASHRGGRGLYVFLFGHSIQNHMGHPHDPGYFTQINRRWIRPRRDVTLAPGDFLMYVGYAQLPNWGEFKRWNYPATWRKAGVKLIWSLGQLTGPTFQKARSKVREDELFIDQHWPPILDERRPPGGCTASIPGYPIKILPASGVTAEAVLWMVNAELFALLERAD